MVKLIKSVCLNLKTKTNSVFALMMSTRSVKTIKWLWIQWLHPSWKCTSPCHTVRVRWASVKSCGRSEVFSKSGGKLKKICQNLTILAVQTHSKRPLWQGISDVWPEWCWRSRPDTSRSEKANVRLTVSVDGHAMQETTQDTAESKLIVSDQTQTWFIPTTTAK